jgi:hypothetical protein
MFCPKCATQNTDEARFCRGCGADISLVPQAVTGTLAERLAATEETRHERRHKRRKRDKPPSIERAVRSLFTGIAFIVIAFAVREWAPAGHVWWFWMFLPAATSLADGVATYLRLAHEGKLGEPQTYIPEQTYVAPPRPASALPPLDTGEMIPLPSVTEATTRHLGVPAERKRGEG